MKHFSSLLRGWLPAALLLWLLTGPAARAQAPAWQSAVAFAQNSGGTSQVTGTVADAAGNIYLTGFFVGTIAFGNVTLVSAGNSDVFVAKWNPATAAFTWAQRAGGTREDRATALALSGSSIYITGYFTGATASFGTTTLVNAVGTATASDYDVFVAKLTDSGSSAGFVWAAQAGGLNVDRAYAIAATGSNVYIAGSFNSPATFGGITLTSSGASAAFVAKLTDSGTSGGFVWAQQASSSGGSVSISALAASGPNVYAAGTFLGTTGTFGPVTLTNASSNTDVFVAKLTDAGPSASFTWAQRAGGIDTDEVRGLVVNGTSLYVSGQFIGTASFGTTFLTSLGLYDIFVTKLVDAGGTGSFAWAQRAGGTASDYGSALTNRGGTIYVAGAFKNTADFGSSTLVSAGNYDVFVAKMVDTGATGAFVWAQKAGGTDLDAAAAITTSQTTIYAAGSLVPAAGFGPIAIPVTGPASSIGFLATLTDPTLTATAPALAGAAFALAPNPARSATTVRLPALPGTTTATLTLRDALGRAMRTATVPLPPAGLRHEFDLSGLAPGLYAVQVQAGAATATRRLVVE